MARPVSLILTSLLAAVLGGSAHGEGLSLFPPGSATSMMALPTGASNARPLSDRLADTLSVRDFGAACNGTTDDSPAVYAATTALAQTGRAIVVPSDCRLAIGPASRQAGKPIVFDGVGLVGEGGRDSASASGAYGTRGGTVLLTDAGAPAFIVRRNWRFEHLIFFWPAMTESAAATNNGTPPALPALLSGTNSAAVASGNANGAGVEVSSGRFSDNDVVNASAVMDFSADPAGALFIAGNRVFFTGVFLKLGVMPLESFVHDNQFTPNAYQSVALAGPTFNLYNYAAQHAEVIRATGNGSANTGTTLGAVQALNFHHNYVFGIGYGLRALGGTFDLADVSNNGFDAVPHVLSIETGGAFDGRFDGGNVYSYTSQNGGTVSAITSAAFYQSSDAAPGTDVTLNGVRIYLASGQFLDFENSTNPTYATLTNVYWNNASQAGANSDGIRWNSPSRLIVQNGSIAQAGGSGSCINLVSSMQSLVITGMTFINCSTVLSFSGGSIFEAVIANNLSLNTRAAIYGGTLASLLPDTFNAWDKAGNGWSLAPRAADGAYVMSYRGTPMLSISEQGTVKAAGSVTGSSTP